MRATWAALLLAACTGPEAAAHAAATAQPAPQPAAVASAPELAASGRTALASAAGEQELERARAALARSLDLAPDPSVAGDLARVEVILGTGFAMGDRAVDLLQSGMEHAEAALRGASPGFAAAADGGRTFEEAVAAVEKPAAPRLAAFVSALDAWSRARGIPTFLGQRAKVRSGIERLMELDPAVGGAAPWRMLGTWLAASPAAAGGDLGRSRAAFERSIELAPDHLENRVAFAATWAVKAQDRTLYERLLQEVLAAPAEQEPRPENAAARRRARDLLDGAGTRF